jgi:hypothetical protein
MEFTFTIHSAFPDVNYSYTHGMIIKTRNLISSRKGTLFLLHDIIQFLTLCLVVNLFSLFLVFSCFWWPWYFSLSFFVCGTEIWTWGLKHSTSWSTPLSLTLILLMSTGQFGLYDLFLLQFWQKYRSGVFLFSDKCWHLHRLSGTGSPG